jgi:ribonuclease D
VTGKRRESVDTQPHAPAFLDSAEDAARFLASIAGTKLLAIDTEGASFHRFIDRIYLMQLSTEGHHAILDPLRVPTFDQLGALLEAPDVEVIFHDADYDLRLLHQDYGWRVVNIFDTRVAAQLLGIKAFGLAALLERFFDVRLDKKHQRADWSMRPLSTDMLEYAAQDTRHLLALRQQLREDLDRKGRWHWAKEEFVRLEGTKWDDEEAGGAFLRIKGARDLSRRELALLRELAQWRDAVARDLDRSTFRVVSNDVLLDLSRKPPASQHDLAAVKGLGTRIASQRGQEIMDAIERGRAVPENELPRFPKAPRWDRDPSFDDRVARLKRVRDDAAVRLDLDPGVLCGRERLEAVARRNPASVEELSTIPELRRWQVEELGESFVRALRNGTPSAGTVTTRAGDSPYRDA